MKKPKPTTRPDRSNPQWLMVEVQDNESMTRVLVDVLDRGYTRWLGTGDRFERLYRTNSIPLDSGISWTDFQKVLRPVVRAWWDQLSRPHDSQQRRWTRSQYLECTDLIEQVVAEYPKDAIGRPLYQGKPMTLYRLTKLISQNDNAPSFNICRKYVRVWMMYFKLYTPLKITLADLKFLQKIDPSTVVLKGDLRQHLLHMRNAARIEQRLLRTRK
ncbi:MAG: hypothetical protein IPP12_18815 [Nitrospira sp.]|nr:hypothetical protein [Nitrospira sp.]